MCEVGSVSSEELEFGVMFSRFYQCFSREFTLYFFKFFNKVILLLIYVAYACRFGSSGAIVMFVICLAFIIGGVIYRLN